MFKSGRNYWVLYFLIGEMPIFVRRKVGEMPIIQEN